MNAFALNSGADLSYAPPSGRLKLANLSRDCLLGGEPFYAGCAEEAGNSLRLIEHEPPWQSTITSERTDLAASQID